MSHLVSITPPIASAHAVKRYAGFGILGAAIPTTGDNGGSPVLNDSINPAAEYHWRVETPPSAGTLVINPDLSCTWDGTGLPDGSYPWVYRLFENGSSQGTATVQQTVGSIAQLVTPAASQQENTASAAAIKQTHKVSAASAAQANTAAAGAIRQTHKVSSASSAQGNQASPGSISQTSISFVSASNSAQSNTVSPAAIKQAHKVSAANSAQSNQASPGSVSQSSTTFISAANSTQANQSSPVAIRQTHRTTAAHSVQSNQVSPAGIIVSGAHLVGGASSVQINTASLGAIRQTHLVRAANSQQINRASSFVPSAGTVNLRIDRLAQRLTRIALAVTDLSVAFSRDTIMSSRFIRGEVVRLHALITTADNQPADPASLTLKVRYDNDPETAFIFGQAPEISRTSPGRFVADITLLQGGVFHYRWETDGAEAGAAESSIYVLSGRFS